MTPYGFLTGFRVEFDPILPNMDTSNPWIVRVDIAPFRNLVNDGEPHMFPQARIFAVYRDVPADHEGMAALMATFAPAGGARHG